MAKYAPGKAMQLVNQMVKDGAAEQISPAPAEHRLRSAVRTLILVLLPLLAGCPDSSRYTPVNWNSEPEPPRHQSPEPQPQPDAPEVDVNHRLLQLHNQQRELKGRGGFTLDSELCIYAQQWANRMAKESNLYHSNIGNVLKLNRFHTAGENIAWNQRSPEQVTNDWMNSPGHRENIMNRNFNYIGFGVAYNERNEPYWCTVFGG